MSALPEYVVDASVAAKWFLGDEDEVDHALRVFDDFIEGSIRLAAPEQIHAELGSTLAVAASPSRNRIQIDAAHAGVSKFAALSIQTTPSRDLVTEAFDFAVQIRCSVYDALYLVLARRRAIPFINADRKLHDRIGHLAGVVWIADYVSAADQNGN
jgi:predicted nucleic acid-binding protein